MKVNAGRDMTVPSASLEQLAGEALHEASEMLTPAAAAAKRNSKRLFKVVARTLEVIGKDDSYWRATPFSW